MNLNQWFAVLFGIVYVLVGAVGFFVTGDVEFTSPTGKDLLIFGINPLHNIIHLALGLVWLIGAMLGAGAARSINILLGVVLLLVGIAGFVVPDDVNILALDIEDNFLHLVTAVLALAVAFRRSSPAISTT
jgi:hypothetical protein